MRDTRDSRKMDVEIDASNGNKRRSNHKILPPSVDSVTHGCKRIKLINSSAASNESKRSYTEYSNNDVEMVNI